MEEHEVEREMELVCAGAHIFDQFVDVEEIDLPDREGPELFENLADVTQDRMNLGAVLAVDAQLSRGTLAENLDELFEGGVRRIVTQQFVFRERVHDVDAKPVDTATEPK